MQIILRTNVENVGRRGDVVKVSDGFARNFLIPKKLAYRLTDGVRKQVQAESRAQEAKESKARDGAQALADQIGAAGVLVFERRCGETGHLFGSVTTNDIANWFIDRELPVEKRQVRIDAPIKALGEHGVRVHLFEGIDVPLTVEVRPDVASKMAMEAAAERLEAAASAPDTDDDDL